MNTMAELRVGDNAVVSESKVMGGMGLRLRDIGLIPGTAVSCVAKSPLGDPVAFFIRGAVIALRSEELSNIYVTR